MTRTDPNLKNCIAYKNSEAKNAKKWPYKFVNFANNTLFFKFSKILRPKPLKFFENDFNNETNFNEFKIQRVKNPNIGKKTLINDRLKNNTF